MRLTALAKKHSFLIFEDRKFADIGSTVKAQYAGGVYNIASWAHITNAHTVPGPGIIAGLREAAASATTEPRALLLLAEMSSSGNLSGGDYLTRSVQMARENADFVIGFIAMGAVPKVNADEDWIVMTPGVDLGRSGDTLGQQYKTPAMVVRDRGSDVIIVGRGIIAAQDPAERAEAYRVAAWEAYETRVHQI
jgi:orotidine-5'-phosphate decarboxylase